MEAVSLMTDESDRATFSKMARDHHRLLLVYARTLVRDEGDARELVQDALLATDCWSKKRIPIRTAKSGMSW
jgi:DNA-directed RNA polymerase specialized sigma24 family protein